MLQLIVALSLVIVVVRGQCENPQGIAKLDRVQFSEVWRVHSSLGPKIFNEVKPCLSVKFTGGDKYTVKEMWRNPDRDNVTEFTTGRETGPGASEGQFWLTLQGLDIQYTILDTDYNTYAAVYVCDVRNQKGALGIHLRSSYRNEAIIEDQIKKAASKLKNIPSPKIDIDMNRCDDVK